MFKQNKRLLPIILSIALTVNIKAQLVEIMPLSQLKVNKHGIAYKTANVETENGYIVNNEIPQNTEFTIKFKDPWGFMTDSAGYVYPVITYSVKNALGENFGEDTIDFGNEGYLTPDILKSLKLTLSMPVAAKANMLYTVKGMLKDKRSRRYTSFEYTFKLIKAGKKLPQNLTVFGSSTTRGMSSMSYGLYFNSFVFNKDEDKNKFLYQTFDPKEFEFSLKGIEGFKVTEKLIKPVASITIYDQNGNELEEISDIVTPSMGTTIKADKKELVFKIKPKVELEKDKTYIIFLKLKDGNNAKNVLDLSLNLYIAGKP